MSGDIGFSSSGGGGSFNFTYTSGSGGSFFGGSSGSNSSNTFVSTVNSSAIDSTINEQINNTYEGLSNLVNPYNPIVQIGQRWIQFPNGSGFWAPIYATNTSYYEYETKANQAQQDFYNQLYSDTSQQYDINAQSTLDSIKNTYTNENFGNTQSIYDTYETILELDKQIVLLELEDTVSKDFNRITDVNNTQTINDLIKTRDSYSDMYDNLIGQYDDAKAHKEFVDEMMRRREIEDQRKVGDWNVDYNWIQDPYGAPPFRSSLPSQESNVLRFFQTGEMNDWFAGGRYYDAPRAGDVFFNELGNLNTLRFLGFEDTNMNPYLQVKLFGLADLHRTLGVQAGDENFSVL